MKRLDYLHKDILMSFSSSRVQISIFFPQSLHCKPLLNFMNFRQAGI